MPSFTKPTDTSHKIQLESHMLYALWMYKRGHAGQDAQLEVKTSLVGNGAKIKITCKNEHGKNLEKTDGVIFNNYFSGKILIPEKVKPDEMVFFEADLQKHGLKTESNLIPVRPPIKVSKIQWDRKEVKPNDVVTMTCEFQSGVEDDDDATVMVYEHNPNSCHIKIVSIPTKIKSDKIELQWEFDYQDDTAGIPTEDEMQHYQKSYANPQFYFIVVVDGVKIGENRESGLLTFKDDIELTLTEFDGTPVPDAKYKITLADGTTMDGKTSSEGTASVKKSVPGKFTVKYFEEEK
jgi:hypothetical protein